VSGHKANTITIIKYYYQGEKIYLDLDLKRISVNSFTEDTSFLDRILSNDFSISEITTQYKSNNLYYFEIEFENSITQSDYYSIIGNLNTQSSVKKASPTFLLGDNKAGLSNNFYVKLKKTTDITILEQQVENFGLEILRQNKHRPLWYVISSSKEHINSLQLSNIFYESGLFESADPDFIFQDVSFSNDPLFNTQWGLKNTGQNGSAYVGLDIKVEEAWEISTGSGVKVAIYDSGFEMDHPDLEANVYGAGFDIITGTSPSQVLGPHGTACAGITGAVQNNGIGISGVAPDSNLISISRCFNCGLSVEQIIDGFDWAVSQGVDVISNSWGDGLPLTPLAEAISNAMDNGRNGLGCIVIFASGNANNPNLGYPANYNIDALSVGGNGC